MSKAVLISIRPEWCARILSGKKTVEIRKTRPRLKAPFKCYIYCTKTKELTFPYLARKKFGSRLYWEYKDMKTGYVVGEFVCDCIMDITAVDQNFFAKKSLVPVAHMNAYADGKTLFGWNISDLKIYDKPLSVMSFFKKCVKQDCEKCEELEYDAPRNAWWCDDKKHLNRAPQSWCYVDGVDMER